MCVLRPLLAPAVTVLLPEEERETLESIQVKVKELTSTIEMPNRLEVNIPLLDCEVQAVGVRILGAQILQQQDLIELVLDMEEAHFRVCAHSPRDFHTNGAWKVRLVYAPFVSPRNSAAQDDKNAYSGLSFTLVNVLVEGELELDNLPNVSLQSIGLDSALEKILNEFSGKAMSAINLVSRDVNSWNHLRGHFGHQQLGHAPFAQASVATIIFSPGWICTHIRYQ